MGVYDSRPWAGRYPEGVPLDLPAPAVDATGLSMFLATVARDPAAPALRFFEDTITFGSLDHDSEALGAALAERGVGRGDRVAVYLQNDPQFAVAQLAVWKVGGVMVSVNPMLKEQELRYILSDSGAVALVTLDELYLGVARDVVASGHTDVRVVVCTRVGVGSASVASAPEGAEDLRRLVDGWDGGSAPRPAVTGGDLACIGYTSGTSGRPKGVMNTHANLVHNAEVYRLWMGVSSDDVFLCGAPLFHITGLVAGLALSYRTGMPLVLFHRFDPTDALRLAERWRCTFTVMAITAFLAMMNDPSAGSRDLSSLVKVYSGGAPVSPAVSAAWASMTGSPIHNIYGLTETTSPSHATPLGSSGPTDPESGALSVGVPVPGARCRIVDPETRADVAAGEVGEILIAGPMVTPGYWGRPDADASSFTDGYLHTGDVGMMDEDGWFFVVDRLKDMINASGYKVWPREVEDFLYQHPAVREAAVVGVPDTYRGETVKAVVSLRAGASASPDEIVAFCRERMAAYKYPRVVEIVDELPKTASGKILRRELRAAATATAAVPAPAPGDAS